METDGQTEAIALTSSLMQLVKIDGEVFYAEVTVFKYICVVFVLLMHLEIALYCLTVVTALKQ